MPSLFIFVFSVFIRGNIIFLLLRPTEYLRWLPAQNVFRAETVLIEESVFFPDAWSSYYLFLALFYKLLRFFGLYIYKTQALVILNIFLTGLAFVFFYQLAKTATGKIKAFLITLFSVVYYPLIYINALNLSENFFFFFLLFGLFLIVCTKNKVSFVAAGFLLGFAAVNRPIFLFFFPFLLAWFVVFKKGVDVVASVFIPIVSVLFFFAFINQWVGQYQHLPLINSNAGVNFAIAQCELKKIRYQTGSEQFWFQPPAYFDKKGKTVNTTVPFYNQSYYFKMGLNCLKNNPRQLLTNLLHIKNVFHSKMYPDFVKERWHRALFLVWKVIGVVLTFFFFAYLPPVKKKNSLYWLFFGLLVSLFVGVYLGNIGEERYLIPYFFTVSLFGPLFLEKLLRPTVKKPGVFKKLKNLGR